MGAGDHDGCATQHNEPMDAEELERNMEAMDKRQRGVDVEIVVDEDAVKREVEMWMEKGRGGGEEGRKRAIEGLMGVEKKGRTAEDPVSTKLWRAVV